ncbi:twin-arginine translocase TatA/TatE family subunit [Pseudomonas sp. NGC7]|uniref:twin-arginine translocase TatA/TatE family subunit n=1 Tax=Pseudomonas sp. NGC7 TaxID=3341775 RepID=UPI0037DBB4F1
MGIFDWKHWIVLLAVVILVFGTKKLKNFGGDLGESIKGFRNAMNDGEHKPEEQSHAPTQPVPSQSNTVEQSLGHIVEGQAQQVNDSQRSS